MTNRKQVAVPNTIVRFCRNGWSQRRLSGELEINRETVARYIRLWREGPLDPAIATPRARRPPESV